MKDKINRLNFSKKFNQNEIKEKVFLLKTDRKVGLWSKTKELMKQRIDKLKPNSYVLFTWDNFVNNYVPKKQYENKIKELEKFDIRNTRKGVSVIVEENKQLKKQLKDSYADGQNNMFSVMQPKIDALELDIIELKKRLKELEPFKKYLKKDIYILTPKEWKQVELLEKFYITTVKQFKELEALLQAKVHNFTVKDDDKKEGL